MPESEESRERRVRDCQPMAQVARRLRRDTTPAEAHLWEIVRNRRCGGYRFMRQHVVGHHVLDFYCAAARLAIEVDGGIHNLPSVRRYDEEREAFLRDEMHIHFLRLTNEQVLQTESDELRKRILHDVFVRVSVAK